MKTKFEFKKDAYSAKKEAFKKSIKKYGLAWKKGSRPYTGSWTSKTEKLYAEWDAEKNTGLFIYEGKNANFLKELGSFVTSIGGKMTKGYVPSKEDIDAIVEQRLKYVIHEGRYPVALREKSAPESYIKAAVADWKKLKEGIKAEVEKEMKER
ncbi:MAG: hypothetical protein IB616_04140 [Methanosarcinales archaeon]|nr:MAG: hypothetical protein IB616_04140 [Methanosarcinales archaeon]